jgi:CubicO group peptidase (beta-lactamase class C family)
MLNGEKPATNPPVQQVSEPGVKFAYSSGGVAISQLIVEDIIHTSYAEYMYKNVLRPLHMTATIYQPPAANKKSLLATSYFSDGKELSGKYHNYPSLAAAGMWSNPTDLSKYVVETQLALKGKSARVLNRKYTQLRLTPYLDKSSALGVFVEKKGVRAYFGHEGSDDGFRCQYWGSINGGDGVVIVMNTASVQMLEEVSNSVALAYHWEGFYQPITKKSCPAFIWGNAKICWQVSF